MPWVNFSWFGFFGGKLGRLGESWEALGEFVGGLGGFQGLFWKQFWRICLLLKQCMKKAKNLGKPLVFHWFSRFWEGSGFQKSPKNPEKIEVGTWSANKNPKNSIWEGKNDQQARFWRPKNQFRSNFGGQKRRTPTKDHEKSRRIFYDASFEANTVEGRRPLSEA